MYSRGYISFGFHLALATSCFASLSIPEKGTYLFSRQFTRRRRIMVSLEYLPYYWKVFSHIWQLYTLGVGKFFHMLKFDL